MAFKLTAPELVDKSSHIDALQEAAAALSEAVDTAQAEITRTVEELNDKIREYNDKLEEANAFVEQVGNRLREDLDSKSEKWKESDAGGEAEEFISTWEAVSFEQLNFVSAPDLFDQDKPEDAETLEGLADGAE